MVVSTAWYSLDGQGPTTWHGPQPTRGAWTPEGRHRMNPRAKLEVIGGKRYNTETAALIAGDDYWDGHNYERSGRQTFLYMTPKGNYFSTHLTCWEGELDSLEPMSQDEAISLFEDLSEKRMDFEKAFPGVKVEDA